MKKVAVYVGFFLLCVIATKDKIYHGDELEVFVQTKALHEKGEFFLDSYIRDLPPERQLRGTHGHIYSKYGLGYPIVAALWLKTLEILRLNHVLSHIHYFKIINSFFFILSAWVLFLFLSDFNPDLKWQNRIVSLGYLLSTQATFYSLSWISNSFSMSLLVFSLYFFWKASKSSQNRNHMLLYCGLLLSLASLTRPFCFLAAMSFMLGLGLDFWIKKTPLKKSVIESSFLIIPLFFTFILQMGINFIKLGQWGSTYGNESFSMPFYLGFLGSLFWPSKSFLFFYPLVVIGVFGFFPLYQKSKQIFWLSSSLCVGLIWLNSQWHSVLGVPEVGQRFWLEAVPFLIFPAALLSNTIARASTLFLIFFGISIQVHMYHQSPGQVWAKLCQGYPCNDDAESIRPHIQHRLGSAAQATFLKLEFFSTENP